MTQPRGAPATLEFALLRGAVEEVPLGIATLRGTEILSANSALERLFDAEAGILDGKEITALFDVETVRLINIEIEKRRVFDGRVRARSLTGRELHLELRFERYRSASAGVGGFLVARDVTLEMGALARIVDASGGVLFRVCLEGMVVEEVSPSVANLTGLSDEVCRQHPILIADLLSVDERERVVALMKRLIACEIDTASAQVTLRTPSGSRVVQLRATGRRDTRGEIGFIDGVVIPVDIAPRRSVAPPVVPEERPRRAMRTGETASTALALVDLGRELLREASKTQHAAAREARIAKGMVERGANKIGEEQLNELRLRIDTMLKATDASLALSRRVRRGFEATSQPMPLREVIAGVAASLEPTFGAPLCLELAGLGSARLDAHADELSLALSYVTLRAHRLAGRGKVSVRGCVIVGSDGTEEAELELVASPPPDPSDEDDGSTDVAVLRRQGQLDRAFVGAQALLSLVGGRIERDEATLSQVVTTVRIPLR